MSSPFRLCLHKVVAVLSIHCRHGYSTAPATPPSDAPPGSHWSVPRTDGHFVQWEGWWVMSLKGWIWGRDAYPNTDCQIFCWRTNLTRQAITLSLWRKQVRVDARVWDHWQLSPAALWHSYSQLNLRCSQCRVFLGGVWHTAGKWFKISKLFHGSKDLLHPETNSTLFQRDINRRQSVRGSWRVKVKMLAGV